MRRAISRRTALRAGLAAGVASQIGLIDQLAIASNRPVLAADHDVDPSDMQFAIGDFVHAAQTFNDGAGNVTAQFGVTFALFVPVKLSRRPRRIDQIVLRAALDTIEDHYPFSPAGVFTFVSYGVPYFNRLRGGINGRLVHHFMPQLLSGQNPDGTRNALAESVPSPTDVVDGFVGGRNAPVPNVTKDRFNVNVRIESNDMLFTFKSDSTAVLSDVAGWLEGSNRLNGRDVRSPDFDGLMKFQTMRLQFTQPGLPRKIADQGGFEFATRINPRSSMFFGFVDQAVDAAAPDPHILTFAGTSAIRFTNAKKGDYFDLATMQHFAHDILDPFQFFALPHQDPRHPDGEPASERLMYAFRANQKNTPNGLPAQFNTADPFTDGGTSAFVPNLFQGNNDAFLDAQDSAGQFTANTPANQQQNATFTGLPRIGHEQALHRFGRTSTGVPLHARIDGPGFNGMDVPAFEEFPGGRTFPAGTSVPKLEFSIFMPTSENFRQMRVGVAAQDLQVQFKVDPDDNGFERFVTATRRQNFLMPPRRHRSFPLVEFSDED
jgi:hypothetical protein